MLFIWKRTSTPAHNHQFILWSFRFWQNPKVDQICSLLILVFHHHYKQNPHKLFSSKQNLEGTYWWQCLYIPLYITNESNAHLAVLDVTAGCHFDSLRSAKDDKAGNMPTLCCQWLILLLLIYQQACASHVICWCVARLLPILIWELNA